MLRRSAVRFACLRLVAATCRKGTRWRRSRPERLLVIRPDHIGDLLLMLPALAALRAAWADWHITLAVGPWVEPLARILPWVDLVEVVPFPGFSRAGNRNLFAPYALAWQLARRWRGRFDTCVVARADHWWAAMVVAAAGIPVRVGYATRETELFLTHALTRGCWHEVKANFLLALQVQQELAPLPEPTVHTHPLHLPLPSWAHQEAERFLSRELGSSTPFLCVHPGAGAPNKLWPVQRYCRLVQQLWKQAGLPVVVTGSRAESDTVEMVAAACPQAIPMAGELSLPGLAALFRRSELVIGADSGPLHLAISQGARTLHIFGPADERRYGPWGDPCRNVVVAAELPCRPCGDLWICRHSVPRACMLAIPSELVLERAIQLLR